MIQLQTISIQRGSKFLLENADLTIYPGQKVGLIGANGSGKSTLFQLLLGELQSDSGSVDIPRNWRRAHMAQEVGHTSRSALDYVLDGDSELRRLEAEIARLGALPDPGEQLAHLYSEMENIHAYTAPARAQQLLNGLGFAPGDDQRPVSDFSGGWRIRLNLAQALMCPSDLLLLDEPTNHLDLDATLWLEDWLKRYPGTLVIISHDRDFLDNIVDRIVCIERQKLDAYAGNYSAFERQRAEKLAQQQVNFEKQQERIAHIEDFIRRFRAKASKARQAQSRIKELERMEKIAPAHVDSPFSFTFDCADKMSIPLVHIARGEIGYGDTTVLHRVELSIIPETRIGLLGPNGAGKSSLIKTLAGSLPLLAGDRTNGEHFKLGYFAQHQLEALDLNASPALHLQRIAPKAREQEIRDFLGSFDFHGERAFEPITHFSGGEKARLALALIAWEKPNVLLLDEPTNHLDLEMRQALTMALQDFEGAVIVVSHDRHLLRNTVDEFWLVADGRVEEFDGDLEDYYRWLGQQRANVPEAEKPTTEPRLDKKAQRQQSAAQRAQLKPLANKLKNLEAQLEKLQKRLGDIESLLGDTSIYDDKNKATLQELLAEQSQLTAQLQETEENWLLISEELEAANG
ncbi:ATP-binding cassette domain-containing protein [Cellvibrio japonicus]|uniref:Probable ATP-binding protein YheS n=1 Tax=Cellvibrio japonicus (strain Ueda107) TaxID=498211 RepID=B3PGV2_CELJU|nr:ATP-binding cassette domain-containing protein [Cellvibrio japonicus]ACE86266.1 ABC transporter, ATP-binding protein [Cellvibrio japonicus Ueda107]QEI13763.1 ATP-binding cassette domain-containing protein [Cellvibrio japonicus]QEI17337.1 ATP-binding cassette domain-containing protein [Cellvibrio japonicus]QEI20914.1 ATP-binding cassette domain-containing protein [Cellvibrio japonicus]